MEGIQKMIRNVTKDSNLDSSSSFEASRLSEGLSSALSSSDQPRVLCRDQSSIRLGQVEGKVYSLLMVDIRVVSLWTCSKLCAICFTVGVVVGYTLKRRVRRWASKLLKRLKDD
uniref:Transmembrane protein n=1 Tax=Cannabis sativa TaxID=3483 RepID=A0A803NTA1_CANSA